MTARSEGCVKIYPFPYGPLYAVPASLTTLGLIFFHIAAFGCNTFYIEYDEESGIGYFRAEFFYGSCESIKPLFDQLGLDFTGVWKFGRFVGVFGALMVWPIFAAIVAASFIRYPRPAKRYFIIIAFFMGMIAFFSLLLLVGLADSGDYRLGSGGVLAIVSFFIWAGAAVSMFFCMKERRPSLPHPREDTADTENPIGKDNVPHSETLGDEEAHADMGGRDPVVQHLKPKAPVHEEPVVPMRAVTGVVDEAPVVPMGVKVEPEIPLADSPNAAKVATQNHHSKVVEPEGISVLKMDYEADIPKTKVGGKPLEP